MIKIKCKTQDTLPLDALTEFQGELKIRDESDYEKISRSIKKHGFLYPIFTWKHGKKNYGLTTLQKLTVVIPVSFFILTRFFDFTKKYSRLCQQFLLSAQIYL